MIRYSIWVFLIEGILWLIMCIGLVSILTNIFDSWAWIPIALVLGFLTFLFRLAMLIDSDDLDDYIYCHYGGRKG